MHEVGVSIRIGVHVVTAVAVVGENPLLPLDVVVPVL
jgi:hypothetical protein